MVVSQNSNSNSNDDDCIIILQELMMKTLKWHCSVVPWLGHVGLQADWVKLQERAPVCEAAPSRPGGPGQPPPHIALATQAITPLKLPGAELN